jgi:hypothetical protein
MIKKDLELIIYLLISIPLLMGLLHYSPASASFKKLYLGMYCVKVKLSLCLTN